MNQGTNLGSQIGRWIVLAALVAVLGALLLTIRPVFAQVSPPGAPTDLKAVVVNGTTIELYWTAPGNTGGSKITGYKIEQSDDGNSDWTPMAGNGRTEGVTADAKPHDPITDLTVGETKHYRVRAINTAGDGTPSGTVSATTTPDSGYPGQPAGLTASANGPSEINLAWTAPTDTGGAEIAGYKIEYSETADSDDDTEGDLPWKELKTTRNDDTKYSDTGLDPVTKRYYRVSAINEDDERGQVSVTASDTTTPTGVAAAPTGLRAVAVAENNVELYWTAPRNTGGAPITAYKIDHSADGKTWTMLGDPDDQTDKTYRVDTTHSTGKRHYQVSAVNGIGKGLVSDSVIATIPDASHPGQPTGLTASADGSRTINLLWVVPTNTGGSPITSYVVEYTEMGTGDNAALPWMELTRTSSNEYSHTGLAPQSKRYYRVSAINSKGSRGPASTTVNETTASSTTPVSVPGAPTGLKAVVVNSTTIELYWTAPGNTGGSKITGYKIEQSDDGNSDWTPMAGNGRTEGVTADAKPHDPITDLTVGETKHYRVRAINTAGDGKASGTVSAATTPDSGYPGQPAGLTASANGPSEINLAWTAPTDTGGAEIAGYKIEYSETADSDDDTEGDLPWKELKTTRNDDTKYSDTGLDPVTKRYYRVSAINEDDERGQVSVTASDTTTPTGVAAAPTGLRAVAVAENNVELYWTAPRNTGGAPITAYKIDHSADGKTWTMLGDPDDQTDKTYRVDTTHSTGKRHYQVSAVNGIGKGLVSDSVIATIPDASHPGQPTGLTASADGSRTINLLWVVPTNTGGSPITSYVVEYTEMGTGDNAALPWMELKRTSSNKASHTGLAPESKRYYRVSAINSKGNRGPASTTVNETTAKSQFILQGSNAVSLDENSGTDLGTYRVVGVDADASVRWTLEGDDSGDFSLDGSGMSRMLKFKSPPNYEMPMDADTDNTYMVTVKASYGSGDEMVMDTQDVTVMVVDMDEPGMVTLSSMSPIVGIEIKATLSDPDNMMDTTWQWSKSMTTMDEDFMDIADATSMTYTPVEADHGYYLKAKAMYSDAHGSQMEMAMTTSAVVSNRAPMFAEAMATRMIAENSAAGTAVGGPVTATDADGDTLTYALSGADDMYYSIDGMGQIMVGANTMLDYETKMSYMVTVTAMDPDGETDTIDVTINVTDVDEGPVQRYDSDDDGEISRSELFDAVDDYFDGGLSRPELFDVIAAYFASNG